MRPGPGRSARRAHRAAGGPAGPAATAPVRRNPDLRRPSCGRAVGRPGRARGQTRLGHARTVVRVLCLSVSDAGQRRFITGGRRRSAPQPRALGRPRGRPDGCRGRWWFRSLGATADRGGARPTGRERRQLSDISWWHPSFRLAAGEAFHTGPPRSRRGGRRHRRSGESHSSPPTTRTYPRVHLRDWVHRWPLRPRIGAEGHLATQSRHGSPSPCTRVISQPALYAGLYETAVSLYGMA